MKVRFKKNHLNYVKDQEVEANEGMAKYWIRVGVCEECSSFDAKERKKELKSMSRPDLNVLAISHDLSPEDYSNKTKIIEAIVLAETPVESIEVNEEKE